MSDGPSSGERRSLSLPKPKERLISPDFHPPISIMGGTVHRYVRDTSPWYKDKFPDKFKSMAPEQGVKPKDGWTAEDWCGNPIAFFPDGMPWPNL